MNKKNKLECNDVGFNLYEGLLSNILKEHNLWNFRDYIYYSFFEKGHKINFIKLFLKNLFKLNKNENFNFKKDYKYIFYLNSSSRQDVWKLITPIIKEGIDRKYNILLFVDSNTSFFESNNNLDIININTLRLTLFNLIDFGKSLIKFFKIYNYEKKVFVENKSYISRTFYLALKYTEYIQFKKIFYHEIIWNGVDSVFFIAYHDSFIKALVDIGNMHYKKTIHISHGLRNEFYRVTEASHYLCIHRYDMKYFNNKKTNCEYVSIGNPRIELERDIILKRRTQRQKNEKLRILFCSQKTSSEYTIEEKNKDFNIVKDYIEGNDNVILTIRLHPSEKSNVFYQNLVSIHKNVLISNNKDIIDDFIDKDIICSAWSTSLISAFASGIPIIWTNTKVELQAGISELIENNIGILSRSVDDFERSINNIKQGLYFDDRIIEICFNTGIINSNASWIDRINNL